MPFTYGRRIGDGPPTLLASFLLTSPTMAEATDFLGFPHPHLHIPILYIADIPPKVKWKQIATVFKPCGAVTSRGRDTVTTNRGVLRRLTVAFQTVFQGEYPLLVSCGEN